jgi:hypothetical protein
MKLPFAKKYFPLSQHESVEGSHDVEKSDGGLPNTLLAQRRSYPTWNQWLPWVLTICLLLINSYTWVELRKFKIDNAVFCKSTGCP